MPVTGPFTDIWTQPNRFNYRIWYRQDKPWREPLPYLSDKGWGEGGDHWAYYPMDDPISGIAHERAYANFVRMVRPSEAQLGVALAEVGKSFDMISFRAFQFAQFLRRLRKGDVFGAGAELQLSEKSRLGRKGWRYSMSDIGSVVLEYRFGWSSLVSDIGGALEVLQGQYPAFAAYGSGAGDVTYAPSSAGSNVSVVWTIRVSERIKAQVQLVNPNLYLLNSLGLVNPAGVAWELVPYSFLVDYFIPIGSFLNSWTDFVGVTLSRAHTSKKAFATDTTTWLDTGQVHVKHRFTFQRSVGVPTLGFPSLRVPNVTPWRAATSVALLLQQLGGPSTVKPSGRRWFNTSRWKGTLD